MTVCLFILLCILLIIFDVALYKILDMIGPRILAIIMVMIFRHDPEFYSMKEGGLNSYTIDKIVLYIHIYKFIIRCIILMLNIIIIKKCL